MRVRSIILIAALLIAACCAVSAANGQGMENANATALPSQQLFYDNFEDGVANWSLQNFNAIYQDHNIYLSSSGEGKRFVEMKRPLMLGDFTLKVRFQIGSAGPNLNAWYRFYATDTWNGYEVSVNRDPNNGDYRVSLDKNLDNVNYKYGYEAVTLDDSQKGTWHLLTVDGRGAMINVTVDTRQLFSVVDDEKPIRNGAVQFTADDNALANIDEIELWGTPSVRLSTIETILDWNLLGLTLANATQVSEDHNIWTIELTPMVKLTNGYANGNFSTYTFSYVFLGFELGVNGLIISIIIAIIIVIAIIIGLAYVVFLIIRRILRRVNRSVNRTVIKGKARIYRARAKSDKDGGEASLAATPQKTIMNDVFISYSHNDKQVADLMTANLESKKIKVWVAPRDVPAGQNYQEAIIDAIDASSMMVLIFSASSNSSPHVVREITRAVSQGVVLIPFRIQNVPLSKSMEYLISVPHWMEATEPPMDDNIDRLAARIKSIMKGEDHGDKKANR
jgi:hypothetical protein